MAMRNPSGRVNYQPNSWGEGPRESPVAGYRHFASDEAGQMVRLRPESFADHYSQARQFFISQTPPEQRHIAMALTFELSKVETLVIRERMVSHLFNIDEALANNVATGLGIAELPKPADAAVAPRQDLAPSPALSIIENGPDRFEGRKLGVLLTDGSDATLVEALTSAIEREKATVEVIAPEVAGITLSDGTFLPAQQMTDGAPSVLYDAVVLLPSPDFVTDLLTEATVRDFLADAFAHCKFIGYGSAAGPLFEKAGIDELDEGTIELFDSKTVDAFVAQLGKLRIWAREPSTKRR